MRRTVGALVFVVAAIVTAAIQIPIARAEDDSVKIFTEAREDFKTGKHEEALKGFERVVALSGSPNAIFYAGKALLELGRLAEAYARFEAARTAAAARAEEEERYAETRDAADEALRALEPRIAKLVVTVPASISGADVSVDGKSIASTAFGESLPMMPGKHTITATAPNRAPVSAEVSLKPGKTKTVPLFASSAAPKPSPDGGERDLPAPDGSDGDGSLLLVGAVVGGVGVAAVAVGAVFGGLSLSKKSEREDNCDGLACNSEGLAAAEDGTTFGNVSTATFVVGGVALAVGVTLVLLSLSDSPDDDDGGAAWHRTRPLTVCW